VFGGDLPDLSQPTAQGPMWLQNAGFIWVPLDRAGQHGGGVVRHERPGRHAKAGMAEQAVIFTRRHNWLMCWLYLGTFGSFIGFSASLPMLAKASSRVSTRWHLVWLGPLMGALLRPLWRLAGRPPGRCAVTCGSSW
jgi:NNP family nitrate/nitrite transporter-like MFS transporter